MLNFLKKFYEYKCLVLLHNGEYGAYLLQRKDDLKSLRKNLDKMDYSEDVKSILSIILDITDENISLFMKMNESFLFGREMDLIKKNFMNIFEITKIDLREFFNKNIAEHHYYDRIVKKFVDCIGAAKDSESFDVKKDIFISFEQFFVGYLIDLIPLKKEHGNFNSFRKAV